MKAKQAHEYLLSFEGDNLWFKSQDLYTWELTQRVEARSHGKPPSKNTIDGVLNEMDRWFDIVAQGLKWDSPDIVAQIKEKIRGETWVEYGVLDPRLEAYRKRSRIEEWCGNPLARADAFYEESWDAMGSMFLADLRYKLRNIEDQT